MAQENSETFEALKKELPHGFSTLIVKRLADRGIEVTARNVQYVAKGQSSNPEIESEILKLLDEKIESKFENEVKKRLEKLK